MAGSVVQWLVLLPRRAGQPEPFCVEISWCLCVCFLRQLADMQISVTGLSKLSIGVNVSENSHVID